MIIDEGQERARIAPARSDEPAFKNETALKAVGDVVTTCPDCGMRLVRPKTFSADRLLHLHRKWGACFPAGTTGDEDTGVAPDSPVVHVDGVARQSRRPA